MKKRLLAIALALMLTLTLLPVMTLEAAADDGQSLGTLEQTCPECKTEQTLEIKGYLWKREGYQFNEEQHWLRVLCPSCSKEGYLLGEPHSGGTETPTCTTGKTCEKCHGEYGKLGHDWGAWTSNGDNKTHTRTCKRDGCTAFETENCGGGDTATCVNLGTCTDCGGQYYGGHNFAKNWESDADTHWKPCLNGNCAAREDEDGHWFAQGNMYLKSAATCISKAVYYTNCASCLYQGTDTYVYEWGQLDPNNHDGGTEVKNAKAATCTEKGYTGDTYCKGCNTVIKAGAEINATGHKLKHTAASAATSRVNGNTEYWYCSGCDKYFSDAEAKTEITQASTVIPATGRRPASTTPAASVSSPKTGDAGVLLYAGMTILSLTGCAWLRRKEQ